MKAIVLFDSRFATSIASAAVVKMHGAGGIVAIDTSSLSKKETEKVGKIVKAADVVYQMIDDSPFKTKQKAEVHYVKPGKKDEARRVLGVWNELTGGSKVPLVIHYLSNVRLSEEQKSARVFIKNAIPTYLRDLEDNAMHNWRKLLSEPQDTALLNQFSQNGQVIEDYLSRFGASKTDKVSAKELKALEAQIAKLEDQKEQIEDLEKEVKEVTSEMELRGKSIQNYAQDKEKLIADAEKAESNLTTEKETHDKTKEALKGALSEATSNKETIVSLTKEVASVRQDLEKTEPILEKERNAQKETSATLVKVREELAVEKKKGNESRKDYVKEVEAVVKLETKLEAIIEKVDKVKKATQEKADKDAAEISKLKTEVAKLKKAEKK